MKGADEHVCYIPYGLFFFSFHSSRVGLTMAFESKQANIRHFQSSTKASPGTLSDFKMLASAENVAMMFLIWRQTLRLLIQDFLLGNLA